MIKKYKRLKITTVIIIFILTSILISNFNIETGEKYNIENTKGIISNNIASLNNDLKGFIDNNEETINNAGSFRGFLWKEAWKYTLKHPLIGGGMESLSTYYIEDKGIYYNSYNDRPHNSLLEVSSFIGIPGAIIYLTLIIYLAITNLKIITNDIEIMIYFTAACYFISSLFGNSMYYTSPYFMILLGLLIGFNRYNKAKLKRQ